MCVMFELMCVYVGGLSSVMVMVIAICFRSLYFLRKQEKLIRFCENYYGYVACVRRKHA